jgi:ABC-type multidrug transport system ATPase subunit
MPQPALAMQLNLADSYRDEIETLVGEDLVPDALDKLQDFVRDLAPQLKHDALMLRRTFSNLTRELRRGLAKREDVNPVIARVLDFTSEVHRSATEEYAEHDVGVSPSAKTIEPPPRPAPVPLRLVTRDDDAATATSAARPAAPPPGASEPAHASTAADRAPAVAPGGAFESLDDLRRVYWRRFCKDRPPTDTVAFKGEGISKSYGKGGFRLEEISFELRAGQITAVVGRNASGKTTLLRIVLGELMPDTGTTEYPLLTRDQRGWNHIKRQIADIPQFPGKWHGRLRPTLNYVAARHGIRGRRNRELIDWHMERYGLTEYENATWDQISGGYKIRFELVRALISTPRLLVLDEPLAYLDVMARQEFLRNLSAVATSLETPVPTIITSQHIYEIEAVADQMILLDDGKCLYAGPQAEIGRHVPLRMIEITLRAPKPQVASLTEPLGLKSIDPTMEGYILAFPKDTKADLVYQALYRAYGEGLVDFRDITNSARSLFQERSVTQRETVPREIHSA